MKKALLLLVSLLLLSCKNDSDPTSQSSVTNKKIAAVSFDGKELFAPPVSASLESKYQDYKTAYLADTSDIESLIWYGRFEAYKANYAEAIEIYTNGIQRFPDDPRLLRHRGHRYISIRQIDNAIKDFELAAKLIEGKENIIEPDGMPNPKGIPVSTLHGNIWYHLGLAYYLKNDLNNALRGFSNCIESGTNDDNLVSATHWIYMILRRLDNKDEANRYLEAVKKDMNIIENFAYHDICLFYKGEKSLEELSGNNDKGASNDAIDYAIANWHLYNGDMLAAKPLYDKLLSKQSWNSFGFIAAEADHLRVF